jgi:hypothetical protein
MAKNTSVIGIYPDRTTVSDAIDVLHKAGYRATDISVLSSDNQGSKDFGHEKHSQAPQGAATGAAVGAVVGAALAWLVTTQTVAIPILAPFAAAIVAAGPVLAAWLAPAPAGRWVGSWDCWRVCLCPYTSPSGTRAESGAAAYCYPFTATAGSGVTGRRKP